MKFLITRFLLSVIISFAGIVTASASPGNKVRTFNLRNGLPSSSVSAVAQNDNGLVWIGTWNGLAFYDGYRFYTFRGGESAGELSTNRILDLRPDSRGNVWFITYDHNVYMLDNRKGRFVNLSEMTSSPEKADYRHVRRSGNNIWIINNRGDRMIKVTPPESSDGSYTVENIDITSAVPGARKFVDVITDDNGNTWIVTDVCAVDPSLKIKINGRPAAVAVSDKTTYLITADGRLYAYLDGRLVSKSPLGDFGTVRDMDAAGDNQLAAATSEGMAVYNLRTDRWTKNATSSGLCKIKSDNSGRQWMLADDGTVLMAAANSAPRLIPTVKAPGGDTRFEKPLILEDRYGTIWIATENGPLTFYNETTGNAESYPVLSPTLKYTVMPEVEKHFVDSNHNLWLLSTQGLSLINFTYSNYQNLPVDSNHETRSLLVARDGSLYAGSVAGVIAKYRPDGTLEGYLSHNADSGTGSLTLSSSPVRFANRVYALYEDKKGNIWVGTKGAGLYTISPDRRVTRYSRSAKGALHIDCDTIYHFDTDTQGRLWIATYGHGPLLAGTDDAGNSTFTSITQLPAYPKGEGPRHVRRITHSPKGEIVMSTNGGLVTFKDNFKSLAEIRFHTTAPVAGDPSGLSSSNVMQALITDNGTYVTSMGGDVQRIPPGKLDADQLKLERPENPELRIAMSRGNILSMIEGLDKSVFFVRETDILRYNPADKSITIVGSGTLSGDYEFSEALPVTGHQGELYFGAVGAAVRLDPRHIDKEAAAPGIVFTWIQPTRNGAEHIILSPENIVLEPENRDLALSFTSLDYSGGHTEYAYRFDGDNDWTYIGTENTLRMKDMQPGVHRLYVRSTDPDGNWTENETFIDIMVKPKFSETVWAKILTVLAILAVMGLTIWAFYVHRRNKLMRHVNRRERDFYVNASHRLRTPLSLIGSPVYEVLKHENLSETGREHLERVRRNAKDMLHVLNTMLEAEFASSGLYDRNTAQDMTDDVVERPSYMKSEYWLEVKDPELIEQRKDITILIVEDNDDLRGFLKDILESQYTILTAPNGKEGLAIAESGQPDFILTDVMMPEMDGLTMVKRIKSHKELSHIPIIVLSAKTSLEDRMEGLRAGIDDYISKPFSATLLRQRIASIIDQRAMLQRTYMEQLGTRINHPASDINTDPTDSTASQTAEPRQEYRLGAPQIIETDQLMMEKLMKFLEERIGDENLRIEEMADAVNMGRTVFYGKIKAIVGMSPSDFLRTLRMQRAEDLIVNSRLNFSQIAFSVGFSDPKYFTKCFKRETGMTPSEYRKQKRGTDA